MKVVFMLTLQSMERTLWFKSRCKSYLVFYLLVVPIVWPYISSTFSMGLGSVYISSRKDKMSAMERGHRLAEGNISTERLNWGSAKNNSSTIILDIFEGNFYLQKSAVFGNVVFCEHSIISESLLYVVFPVYFPCNCKNTFLHIDLEMRWL